jgi:O-antigen/teichoic acid export membrane protein
MGLIQRQGVKYSIVNWIGILIGAFSTLFVFPNALEEYGLMRFILDTSTLFFPLLSFGISSIAIRFFPYFEDCKNGNNGFLGFLLLWGGVSYLCFITLFFIFYNSIFTYYQTKGPLFSNYFWLILPASLFITFNNILNQYAVNYKRIVIPSLLLDVSQKIILPLLIISYLNSWVSLNLILGCLIFYLFGVMLGFITYIKLLNGWNLRINSQILTPALVKEIKSYAVFGATIGVGFFIVSRIDTWLVSTVIGLKSNGIYSISGFIANVLEVPARAITGISVPLLTKYWKENNLEEIKSLYQKASINLFILGLLLFGIFWASVDVFFKIIANSESMIQGKNVILILSIGRLFDMATGLNNHILGYSTRYRLMYIQVALPAIFSITAGWYLTSTWGINGAATSTLLSIVLYNTISLYFNWICFKLTPFSSKTLLSLTIAIICFLGVSIIPLNNFNVFIGSILKSILFGLTFLYSIWRLQISDDLNSTINIYLSKLNHK